MIDGKSGGGGGRCSGVGGSRLRTGVERIFQVYLEIALVSEPPTSPTPSSSRHPATRVVRKFPPDFDDAEVLKSAANFAFPNSSANRREEPDHGQYTYIAMTYSDSLSICLSACSLNIRLLVPLTCLFVPLCLSVSSFVSVCSFNVSVCFFNICLLVP